MLESGVSSRRIVERMRPIAEILPDLLERLPLEPVAVLRGLWKKLVGEALAERTEPVDLRDGVLHVAVQVRAWRPHVQALEVEIIAKINQFAGQTLVRELRLQAKGESPQPSAEGER